MPAKKSWQLAGACDFLVTGEETLPMIRIDKIGVPDENA
jgi:hypothetical protein